MKPSIIISSKDAAGMNIKEELIQIHGWKETSETFQGVPVLMKDGIKLYTIEKETIYADHIDDDVEGECLIFATKHAAESGVKSFTVHAPGNWGEALAGGAKKELCTAMPSYMKEALKKILNTYHGDEFQIVQECTHHGPILKKPSMFIEIGSTQEEWVRKDAAEIIAHTINHLITNPPKRGKCLIVLGGGHYNQISTKLMLRTEFAVSHICPKHNLQALDTEMIQQAIDKSGAEFDKIIIDWKGLGPEKKRIIELLERQKIPLDKYQKMTKEIEE